MKTIKFDSKKYGKELLLDLGKFEETPNFFFEEIPHTVDFYEIFIFQKAKGSLQLDDQIIPLKDNLIVYATAYQRRIWKVDKKDIQGHFFIFANNFFERFFANTLFVFKLKFFHNYQSPLYLEETPESKRHHEHAFQKIRAELENLQDDSEDFIQAFLLIILAGHNRRYCQEYGIKPERNSNTEAYEFKRMLEDQIRSNPKVEDFARQLNISRITLNKHLKAKFGQTATQLIKDRLQTEIERELLFSHKTIAEIAFELKFSEPQHLIRFFKNRKGQSPSEFRRAYQNGN